MDIIERETQVREDAAPPPPPPAPDDAVTRSYAAALEADAEDDRRARLRRIALLVVGLPVLAGAGYLGWTLVTSGESTPQRQVINTVTTITLPPPPPPPPPPPKTDPPPEPVVKPRVEETPQPLQKVEPKPEPPKPAPQQPPAPPAGLGLPTGPGGPNAFGLGQGGDGTIVGGTGPGGGGGGSRFGGYAGSVQTALQRALQQDERTRRGNWRVTVRIYLGPGGQVTQAQLVGTSGDPARDAAIQRVLSGLSVQPPPPGMPLPIVARIESRA